MTASGVARALPGESDPDHEQPDQSQQERHHVGVDRVGLRDDGGQHGQATDDDAAPAGDAAEEARGEEGGTVRASEHAEGQEREDEGGTVHVGQDARHRGESSAWSS